MDVPRPNIEDRWGGRHVAKTCPRCGAYSLFKLVGAAWPPSEAPYPEGFGGLQCSHCYGVSVISAVRVAPSEEFWGSPEEVYITEVSDEEAAAKALKVTGFYPPAVAGRGVAAAPESVQDALREAEQCQAVNAVHGGALMCRRAIQLIARDQGAEPSNLQAEIDGLDIPQRLKEAAHAIRLVGNDAAHPDPLQWEAVTREELAALLHLAYQIVHYLYELPSQIESFEERTRAGAGQET